MSINGMGDGFGAGYASGVAAGSGTTAGAIAEAHYQDRVAALQVEIAKATDPLVKAQLQQVLADTQAQWQDQQKRGKRQMIIVIVVFLVILVAMIIFALRMFSRMGAFWHF
ncbi:MAG: hypothetical protein FWD80_01230 [Propionibacteriaceae bacterium]|nr:hypothetical protein [Propionibacteriaceae bacterium]